MAEKYTIILSNDYQRQRAKAMIDRAPPNVVVTYDEPRRSLPQNAKMHAMLTELALAKPDGRSMPVHKWKALAMDMAGCKPEWERSLDGDSMVCVGYKSSRLSKDKMSDVIEAIRFYAATHNVQLKDPTDGQ